MTTGAAKTRTALEPVRPLAIKERVIGQLTRLIEDGSHAPGERLPSERELSEELRVSRGTIREAVQFLQALGLVEIRHGSGTFVRAGTDGGGVGDEWREWTIRHAARVHDLLEVRRGLESFAAEVAAARAGEADLAAMEDALALMDEVIEPPDVPGLVQADIAFHHALCGAAGNAALSELADSLGEQLLRERGAIWNILGRPAKSLVEHRAICEAVRDGDPARARQAVIDHLESVEEDLGASILGARGPTTKG